MHASSRFLSPLAPCAFVLFLVTSCGWEEPPAPTPEQPIETTTQAIVNGQVEEGWPAVGALTRVATAYGYMGSFCSGTLIAPQWVLTAGHCLAGQPDDPLFPENVKFFIGTDSNPSWIGQQPEGKLYQADAFYIHPGYNSVQTTGDDIALMHLAEPVEDVDPVAFKVDKLESSIIYQQVLYVGYGVTSGIKQTGGGIKRSGNMILYMLDKNYYVSGYEESGVCFGDSGGPGLYQFNGTWRIIGVNSSVMSRSEDPCTGAAIQTRVDPYASWIYDHLNGDAFDCRVQEDLCFCPQACQANGSCDPAVCKTYTCDDVYKCFKECETPACQARCYIRASADGLDKLHNYYWCRIQHCYNAQDVDNCALQWCSDYMDECQDVPNGASECRDIHSCVLHCSWDDPYCWSDCYYTGTPKAQADYDALWRCFEDRCQATPYFTFQDDCAWQQCAYEVESCAPPVDCALVGGDCKTGTACWYSPMNKLDCFPSDGAGEGDPCALIPLDTRPCADGLQCVQVASNTECRRVCTHESHCDAGEVCVAATIDQMPDFGYCECLDEDGDGFCSLVDCDDSNPDIHPAKGEKCWDGVDNDCDGDVDEGCVSETDAPGHGAVEGDILVEHEDSGCSAARSRGAGPFVLLFSLLALALGAIRRRRTA